jgi:hypothetical protein
VGDITPEAARLIKVTEDALYVGIDKARPNGFLGDISAAIQRTASVGNRLLRSFQGPLYSAILQLARCLLLRVLEVLPVRGIVFDPPVMFIRCNTGRDACRADAARLLEDCLERSPVGHAPALRTRCAVVLSIACAGSVNRSLAPGATQTVPGSRCRFAKRFLLLWKQVFENSVGTATAGH